MRRRFVALATGVLASATTGAAAAPADDATAKAIVDKLGSDPAAGASERRRVGIVIATVQLLAVCTTLPAAAAPTEAVALSEVGTSQKICQLTGNVDWETGQPTAARTFSNFGLDAVDLGYPVDDGKTLFLLFGDTWPSPAAKGAIDPPNDAVGFTTRTKPPAADSGCLDLQIDDEAEVRKFAAATVIGPVVVRQGAFNVPSGGVSVGRDLFAFFWTNHCGAPAHLRPVSAGPLARPAPSAGCPETDARNSVGSAVMASSTDGGRTFGEVVSMPPGFVYSTAVNASLEQGLPTDQRLGIFVFGVPRYRASAPYLAYVPAATLSNPATWRFLAGVSADGTPNWVTEDVWGRTATANWTPPPGAEITQPADDAERCIGELSVTWNQPLDAWLMLNNCPGGIEARIAPAPWGPWSAPINILGEKDDGVACELLMTEAGCATRRDYWPGNRVDGKYVAGGFYAPFVLGRYTSGALNGPQRDTTIYWLVSTWNPYEVNVMRSTLRTTPQ